jgi:hypothetical protein
MIYNISSICLIISALLTLLSAFFFSGQFLRTDDEINKMTLTCCGGNGFMSEALKKDRKNAQIGLCLITLGVFCQVVSFYLT